jgi:MFS family permease
MAYRTLRDLTLLAGSVLTIIGTTAIAAALPGMSEHYAGTPHAHLLVKVSLTVPALAAALAAPLSGLVVDRYGRKPTLAVATAGYGLAGTAGAYLPSLPAILASRFLLGLAVGAILTCVTALLADYAGQSALSSSLGRQSLAMAVGNVTSLFLGGVLAELGWRWPFWIYAAAFPILAGILLLVHEPRPAVAGPAAHPAPVPVGRTALLYAVGLVNMVTYFLVPTQLPFLVRELPGGDGVRIGALLALVSAAWGLSSWQYGRLRRHLSYERLAVLALALTGAAYLLLARADGYPQVVLALAAVGLGLGVTVPNLNAWLLSFVPAGRTGQVFGGLVFFVFLGQFVSPLVGQPLVAAGGVARGYLVGGAVLLAGVVGALAVQVSRGRAKQRRVGIPA